MSDIKEVSIGETDNKVRPIKKKPWRRPEVILAAVEDTETGIDFGPEVLVLLS